MPGNALDEHSIDGDGDRFFGLRADDAEGLRSEADDEYALLPQNELRGVAGISRLPDPYLRHFRSVA